MTYTKETKIKEIPNSENIMNDTIQIVKNIYETYTIGDFINTEKETGEESFASTTFGVFGGCGTGAAANVPKKFKGSLAEKVGQALATWRKNEKGLDKVANAVKNEKMAIAENMARANLKADQIAVISGLSLDVVQTIIAKIKGDTAK